MNKVTKEQYEFALVRVEELLHWLMTISLQTIRMQ